MKAVGPFRSTQGTGVEIVFIGNDPVVTDYSCNELKRKELCQPVEGLCSNAGVMRPDDVERREGVKPVCRERA